MPKLQLFVDTDDPDNIRSNIGFLQEFLPEGMAQAGPEREPQPIDLPAKLHELLDPPKQGDHRRHGYGENRRAWVRAVASQPHGARHEDVLNAVRAADPAHPNKDHGRAIGGTHSSFEAGYRALGLPGAIWNGHVLPNECITYRSGQDHTMDPVVAEVALAVLAEIDAGA